MAYSIDAGKSTNYLPMYAGKNLVGPDYIHLPWFLGHTIKSEVVECNVYSVNASKSKNYWLM